MLIHQYFTFAYQCENFSYCPSTKQKPSITYHGFSLNVLLMSTQSITFISFIYHWSFFKYLYLSHHQKKVRFIYNKIKVDFHLKKQKKNKRKFQNNIFFLRFFSFTNLSRIWHNFIWCMCRTFGVKLIVSSLSFSFSHFYLKVQRSIFLYFYVLRIELYQKWVKQMKKINKDAIGPPKKEKWSMEKEKETCAHYLKV